jgi:hypothetical protein
MSYRQSGIEYRESDFVYNRSDATLNVGVINVVCGTPTLFEFPYRKSGTAYRNSFEYRQPASNNNTYVVKAFPATLAVTTAFSAVAGKPIDVSASTIEVVAGVATNINVDANYIELDEGMTIPVGMDTPSLVVGNVLDMASISVTTAMDSTQEAIVRPEEIAATVAVPAPADVSGDFSITTGTIKVVADAPDVLLHRILTVPQSNTLPPVLRPQDASKAAFALRQHYNPTARGINLIIINNTSVQTFMPADFSTVTRVIYGGHESPNDLTGTEQAILIAAGYQFRVGEPV